jgi:nucleoid-associated protein
MALTSIISHHILRHSPTTGVDLHLRPDAFAANGKLEDLVYELKSNFIRKSGKSYGRFSGETSEFPFSAWLKEYRAERLGFASFTHKAAQHFKLELEKTECLIDAYLFFVEEKIEAGEFLHVFMAEHLHGSYLDAELALDDSRYLDTQGFALAAKIDLSDWDAGHSATYLSLLRSRGEKELSDAFANLVGFSDKYDIKNDTAQFLQIVDDYAQEMDEQAARVTRTKVVDYCLEQNKAGKAVVIADLSQTLASEIKTHEPEHFSRFVQEKQPDKKAEFIPDSSQIRNYVRISGRNDSLSMSFASECLGKEIVYDAEQDVLTIKNIPPALKAKLLKHMKGE